MTGEEQARAMIQATYDVGFRAGIEAAREAIRSYRKEILAPSTHPLDPGIGPATMGAEKACRQIRARLARIKDGGE